MKPTFITNSQVEWLKWIGIFAMVLDHIAIVFSEKMLILRFYEFLGDLLLLLLDLFLL